MFIATATESTPLPVILSVLIKYWLKYFISAASLSNSTDPQLYFLRLDLCVPTCILNCLPDISNFFKPEKLSLWSSVPSLDLQDFPAQWMNLPSNYFCKPETWGSPGVPLFPLHSQSINCSLSIFDCHLSSLNYHLLIETGFPTSTLALF